MKNNPKANYNFQIAQLYGEKGAFKKCFNPILTLSIKTLIMLKMYNGMSACILQTTPKAKTIYCFEKPF